MSFRLDFCHPTETRSKANSGFDDLPVSLGTMDFYLQMYPDDPVIIEASVNLVVAMFKAIENSVAFYTGHKGGFYPQEFDVPVGVAIIDSQ